MTRRWAEVRAGVALVVAVSMAATAGAAGAAPAGAQQAQQARLAAVKARADAAIDAREAVLAADGSLATTAAHLSGPDRAALQSLVSANAAGLTQLRQTIDSDTAESQVVADAESIVTSYRVYTLVDPKVHLVVAADRGAAAVGVFTSIEANLQTAVDAGGASIRNPGGARAALAQLQQDVAAAAAVIDQVPGQVLPLTPAGYPGNRSTLVAAAGSLATARSELEQAATAARAAIADLNGG